MSSLAGQPCLFQAKKQKPHPHNCHIGTKTTRHRMCEADSTVFSHSLRLGNCSKGFGRAASLGCEGDRSPASLLVSVLASNPWHSRLIAVSDA